MVRYNKALDKMMVVGGFEHVNGQPRQQMAMLNPDGTLDETFVPREIGGGTVNFAQLIDWDSSFWKWTVWRNRNSMCPGLLTANFIMWPKRKRL